MTRRTLALAVALALAATGVALAQNPTGSISGRVIAADGTPLPGVTVTASSPQSQGDRTTVSIDGGAYILPFLQAGDYTIKFELEGFAPLERAVKVAAAQTKVLDAEMSSTTLTEEIVVTGSYETISTTPTAAVTFEKKAIEELPVNRDIRGAATLAPGVSTTGPGGNISIAGSMSFENLFLVNGVVVNENLRGQAFDLFIEDAIQETTISSSGISAEYGRFSGGVVNTLTRSGGNEISASLRTNFENESWVKPTPVTTARADKINKIYEGTLGGYILRDKLWFFAAGRDFDTKATGQTSRVDNITQRSFDASDSQTRLEGKLTFSATPSHRFVGTYMDIDTQDGGNRFGSVLDTVSVTTRELPQELKALNYTGVLTSNFFVEAQYSEREFAFVGSGSLFTDRIKGTLLITPAGFRWNSPTFCGVCVPEGRDNENALAKASYFLSTDSMGSHEFVAGYDSFTDIRTADNHQSGSDYRILNIDAVEVNGTLFPRISGGATGTTIIQFNPIAISSKGTDFKTNSIFLNDRWQLNDRWSFNLGVRYDQNDGSDAEGKKVVDDSKISPRVGLTWDASGDGDWVVNASYARYVAAIANNQADSSSKGGQPATIQWFYRGPSVNLTGTPTVDTATALGILFNWFDSVGGPNNTSLVRALSIPGLTAGVGSSLASPHTDEMVVGVTKRLGTRGLIRADLVRREGGDFYNTIISGKVNTPNGLRDFSLLVNDDGLLDRTYNGLHVQGNYRINDRWNVGGNYTLSQSEGNFDGETVANGPVSSATASYREYKAFAQHNPSGDLGNDQRHRARGWVMWDAFKADHHRLNVSLLHSFFSGTPYGAAGAVDSRPYVTNPGYAAPPSAVTYWFTARDAFHTPDIQRTDIAVNYSFNWNAFGRDFEVFLQPEVLNVMDNDDVITVNTTVQDRTTTATLTTFNPFTTTPVEGTHWRKGTSFGKGTVAADFQTPRTFRFSVGVRF